jgi:hypothetical protein
MWTLADAIPPLITVCENRSQSPFGVHDLHGQSSRSNPAIGNWAAGSCQWQTIIRDTHHKPNNKPNHQQSMSTGTYRYLPAQRFDRAAETHVQCQSKWTIRTTCIAIKSGSAIEAPDGAETAPPDGTVPASGQLNFSTQRCSKDLKLSPCAATPDIQAAGND